MTEKIYIFDTTLRDGAQTQGVDFSIDDKLKIAEALGSDSGKEVGDLLGMFQMGPRTGNPVYNERYAEDLLFLIKQKCPNGRVSGLTMTREQSERYPVISGEIVKVTGHCLRKRSS